MRHQWDEGEWFMDTIISECAVCGGFRTRKRVAGLDYINTGTMSIDMTGSTRKGWRYAGTPRSCPGEQEAQTDE